MEGIGHHARSDRPVVAEGREVGGGSQRAVVGDKAGDSEAVGSPTAWTVLSDLQLPLEQMKSIEHSGRVLRSDLTSSTVAPGWKRREKWEHPVPPSYWGPGWGKRDNVMTTGGEMSGHILGGF